MYARWVTYSSMAGLGKRWAYPARRTVAYSDDSAAPRLNYIVCPVHTQATALGVVGDSVAQRLERRWNPGQRYELKRTVHAGILNMIIGTQGCVGCSLRPPEVHTYSFPDLL